MTLLHFGRDICCDDDHAVRREWLVTNGIGGYASGTIANILTRRYHGYLVAALAPPFERRLLLTKLDEIAHYDGNIYPLSANRWVDGIIDPSGFLWLDSFRLEGTMPVWTFACADALLEKRLWMQQGANTTYVSYTLRRATLPLTLVLSALVNDRDHHGNTRAGDIRLQVIPVEHGLRISRDGEGSSTLLLLSDRAIATSQATWYWNFWLSAEQHQGSPEHEDHFLAGSFEATLPPGESLLFVASSEESPSLLGTVALRRQQQHEQQLLAQWSSTPDTPKWMQQLILAANQFVVQRRAMSDQQCETPTIAAGYHWFGDWNRDTFISLPGLTLITGQYNVAAQILRSFAPLVNQGMLPNHVPETNRPPSYTSVDTTLWYIEAIRAYYAHTNDETLIRDLFPVLENIMVWHLNGTRHRIHCDPQDGLLYGGEPGVQLTWMDARVNGWGVTPRTGKPIEVNALWYHALHTVADFARTLGASAEPYARAADHAAQGFARFWNAEMGYCYDVLDGPDGHDATLRPNQILAVALLHSPLAHAQQRAVVDICARRLLTPMGLRSLSPDDPHYCGHYGGEPRQRYGSYHQGTVWGWMIGPFVQAHLRVYGDVALARSYLEPLAQSLAEYGIGTIGEIFDGDAPFTPRGCIAQAWNVAEVLRAWSICNAPTNHSA